MAHTILYPAGHKKAFTRKAAKDLTFEERRTVDDQRRIFHMGERARARHVLNTIDEAKRVLEQAEK